MELQIFGNSGVMVGHLRPQLSVKVYHEELLLGHCWLSPSKLAEDDVGNYFASTQMKWLHLHYLEINPAIEIT